MKKKVREQIQKFHMIDAGDHVFVALSGGADSVALLLLLSELREEMNFELQAIHIEHGIRGVESLADAEFSQDLCARLGIECHVESVDALSFSREKKIGLEEAARTLRYDAFRGVMEDSGLSSRKLAVAHHANDQAETMLFAMARGTGVKGLGGMQPISGEREDGLVLIRPLLGVTREQIETFLLEREQDYCVDRTNADESYSRNRIRSQILPALKAVNEESVEHLASEALHLQEIDAYLTGQAKCLLAEVAECEEEVFYKGNLFLQQPHILQGYLIRMGIESLIASLKDVTSVHVESIISLFENAAGKTVNLPYGISAFRETDGVRLAIADSDYTFSRMITAEMLQNIKDSGETLAVGGYQLRVIAKEREPAVKFRQKAYTNTLDYDKIKDGFAIRTREDGDWFLLDSKGSRKRVNRELIDRKISTLRRRDILVVADATHVGAILGSRKAGFAGRTSYDMYVDANTEFIIEFTEGEREN